MAAGSTSAPPIARSSAATPPPPQTDFDGCALSGPHTRYATAIRDGGILYQVTGDPRYARRAREILLAYAARYLDYPLHTTTQSSQDRRRPRRTANAR